MAKLQLSVIKEIHNTKNSFSLFQYLSPLKQRLESQRNNEAQALTISRNRPTLKHSLLMTNKQQDKPDKLY